MSIKSRLKHIVALPLFLLAVLAAQFVHVVPTSAATLTWTGGGDGSKFSDAANWSTGQVPVTGDALTFPGVVGTNTVSLQNDLTNVVFSGVQLSLTASSSYGSTNYTVDKLKMSDGATIAAGAYPQGASNTVSAYLGVTDLVANGDLTVSSYMNATKFTVAGNLLLMSGVNFAAGSTVAGKISVGTSIGITNNVTAASYELKSYGTLSFYASFSSPFTTPITVATGATRASLSFSGASTYDPETQTTTYADRDYTLGSPITLNSDLQVYSSRQVTARLGGQITLNGHAINKQLGSEGRLFVGDTEIIPETKTTNITDSAPNASVEVAQNETTILDGERGYVSVYSGGVLKGTGKVDSMYVNFGGVVAPGHSPGTMTIASDVYISGEYQAEVLNKDNYDKLVVGQDFNGNYSAVGLDTTSHLNVILPAGYAINQGDQFTIIDNKSNKDVEGVFGGLPEGTQFTVNNVVFNITYKGGDGNDVVLTALNTGKDVSTPNTGAEKLSLVNPVLVAGLGIATAVLLIAVALTRRKTTK